MPTRQLPVRRPRCGFSVVEVLVALVLVTVGLLAMAGSTTLALRTALDAQRRREATHRIESRFAGLAAAGCSRAASGIESDPARQLSEGWTVHAPAGAFATITDSVSWLSASGRRSMVLTSAIPC
jgi:prepilin-type N-terminal cleavage/methylation domain-containing protein